MEPYRLVTDQEIETQVISIYKKFKIPPKPYDVSDRRPTLQGCIKSIPEQESLGYSAKFGFVPEMKNGDEAYLSGFGADFTLAQINDWLDAHPEYQKDKVVISSSQYYSDSSWPTLIVDRKKDEIERLGQKKYQEDLARATAASTP